jgi:hypothetical protein
MIKVILTKIYRPIQIFLYNQKRKKGMKKMMSHYLKIKPSKVCATYKTIGTIYESISSNV